MASKFGIGLVFGPNGHRELNARGNLVVASALISRRAEGIYDLFPRPSSTFEGSLLFACAVATITGRPVKFLPNGRPDYLVHTTEADLDNANTLPPEIRQSIKRVFGHVVMHAEFLQLYGASELIHQGLLDDEARIIGATAIRCLNEIDPGAGDNLFGDHE